MTNFKFSFKKSCNGTTIKYKKIEVVLQLKMVVGDGFEPSKSATADLQSAPFGRSGIPPIGAGEGNRTLTISLEG